MVSERELAFLCNPEAVARVREGIAQAERGEVTGYPPSHFQRLAAELGDGDEEEEED